MAPLVPTGPSPYGTEGISPTKLRIKSIALSLECCRHRSRFFARLKIRLDLIRSSSQSGPLKRPPTRPAPGRGAPFSGGTAGAEAAICSLTLDLRRRQITWATARAPEGFFAKYQGNLVMRARE
uniref:Uncharacterized protein n=1 Tax=Aegilops tauschii TaxID=37682 RepID=M8BVP1_AEGTA